MKKVKFTLLISIILLVVTSYLKTKFNLNINTQESKIILQNMNYKMAMGIFIVSNLFIVFISAFGTNLFLNIFVSLDLKTIKDPLMKTRIYIYYFLGHSILNFIIYIYSILNNDIASNYFVNMSNLIFYVILSYIFYVETKKILSSKKLIIFLLIIFILNSISAIWFFITN